MRKTLVSLGLGTLAACSSFGSDGDGPTNGPDPDADASFVDAGNDGRDPVTGEPAEDSFIVTAAPSALQITQGLSATLTLTVKRGKQLTGPIAIALSGLPMGVAAAPLTITGDTGDLKLDAASTATQGPASLTLQASASSSVSTTHLVTLPISAVVRGAPGAIDTTWTQESLAVSPSLLALAPDDSIYLIGGCFAADGMTENVCVAHVGANGKQDSAYAGSGVARIPQRDLHAAVAQADGSLVITGSAPVSALGPCWAVRLTPVGQPDNTFAGTGTLSFGGLSGTPAGTRAVTVRGDGNIFFAWNNSDTSAYNAVSRVDSTGSYESNFGGTGSARSTTNNRTIGMVIRSSGAPPGLAILSVVPAISNGGNGVINFIEVNSDTAAPFPQYTLGVPKSIPLKGLLDNEPAGIAEVASGGIVAPFYGTDKTTGMDGLFLAKFDASGSPGANFGTNGLAGPFPIELAIGDPGAPSGVAAQGDGKILVSSRNGHLMRFTAVGTPDADFGSGGTVETSASGLNFQQRVAVQKTGRIVVNSAVSGATQLSAYWQ